MLRGVAGLVNLAARVLGVLGVTNGGTGTTTSTGTGNTVLSDSPSFTTCFKTGVDPASAGFIRQSDGDKITWKTTTTDYVGMRVSGGVFDISGGTVFASGANLHVAGGGIFDLTGGLATFTAAVSRVLTTQVGATYSVGATDTHIIANRAGTMTLTLGTATAGRELTIRTIQAQTVVSAGSNVVPLAGGSAGTAILAGTAGKWALLVGDGANWQIQASN